MRNEPVTHLISPYPLHADPPRIAHSVDSGQGQVPRESEGLTRDGDGPVRRVGVGGVAEHARKGVGGVHTARAVELDLGVHPGGFDA